MAYADFSSEVEIIFNDQTKRINLVACFSSSSSQTQIKNIRVFKVGLLSLSFSSMCLEQYIIFLHKQLKFSIKFLNFWVLILIILLR